MPVIEHRGPLAEIENVGTLGPEELAPRGQSGYGLVEQRQHRRQDCAEQRVESVHGIQVADIADGALSIVGGRPSSSCNVAKTATTARLASTSSGSDASSRTSPMNCGS